MKKWIISQSHLFANCQCAKVTHGGLWYRIRKRQYSSSSVGRPFYNKIYSLTLVLITQ